jgi:50S ribosomal protein L16 3-hydroxylase
MELDIAALIQPTPIDQVVAACRRGELYHHVLASEQSNQLRPLLPVDAESACGWLAEPDAQIRAIERVDGTPRNELLVSPAADVLLRRYREGASLLTEHSPVLVRNFSHLEASIASAFGIPVEVIRTKLSLSQSGAGFPMHFDRSDSIQIQVDGTKRWRCAPNAEVRAPLHGHTAGALVPQMLRSYTVGDLPDHPADSEVTVLAQGELLFVPRGYWHGTEAGEPSMSLAIRIGAPSWLHFLPASLRMLVIGDWRWREPAFGAWRAGTGRAGAVRHLAVLLTESLSGLGLDAEVLVARFSVDEYLELRSGGAM